MYGICVILECHRFFAAPCLFVYFILRIESICSVVVNVKYRVAEGRKSVRTHLVKCRVRRTWKSNQWTCETYMPCNHEKTYFSPSHFYIEAFNLCLCIATWTFIFFYILLCGLNTLNLSIFIPYYPSFFLPYIFTLSLWNWNSNRFFCCGLFSSHFISTWTFSLALIWCWTIVVRRISCIVLIDLFVFFSWRTMAIERHRSQYSVCICSSHTKFVQNNRFSWRNNCAMSTSMVSTVDVQVSLRKHLKNYDWNKKEIEKKEWKNNPVKIQTISNWTFHSIWRRLAV